MFILLLKQRDVQVLPMSYGPVFETALVDDFIFLSFFQWAKVFLLFMYKAVIYQFGNLCK